MPYTLGEAAKHIGLSKPTVQRAIKNGKLSASRNEDGSYSIDPAELERAFPLVERTSNANGHMKQHETANSTDETGGLQVEVAVLRSKLAATEEERRQDQKKAQDTIDDLRRRLDAEAEERRKLTAILTDQRKPPEPAAPPPATLTPALKVKRGWWHRLTG